jgi:class 3 adenylate cyclase
LIIPVTTVAQSTYDSLFELLERSSGTERVDLLNELAHDMEHVDPDSSMILCKMSEDLARSIGYNSGLAKAYLYRGNVFSITNMYDDAIQSFDSAVILYTLIDDQEGLLKAVNNIGNTYRIMGNYDEALYHFIESLRISEQIEYHKGIAYASLNIGLIYSLGRDKDETKGLPYFLRALEICQETDDKRCIAYALNNISLAYISTKEYDRALEYLEQSLELKKSSNDLFGVATAYNNIGDVYTLIGEFQTSIDYNNQALEIYQELNDSRGLVHSLLDIAKAYTNLEQYDLAEKNLEQAYTHSQSVESLHIKSATYLYMYQFYETINDYREALRYHILYNEINDSIYTETSSEQMAEMRTQYETEKKEAEIHQLTNEKTIRDLQLKKSENQRIFFLLAAIMTFLLAGFAYFGFRQKQKANKFLEERNKFEIESKERAINLFGQQVSREVADELLSDSFKAKSKKVFACIMFLDIRDFTPFVANMEPKEIIKYQNDVFGFMIDIIGKHHGIINQFMGDGFMATFGAPVSSGNDCQNAIDSAIKIVQGLKLRIENSRLPKTKIGLGLHAGYIVTGNVGTKDRKQYSITGNTVILASRIEQLNKQHDSEILISKEVLDKIDQANLNYEIIGPKKVKGRTEPMEIIKIIT